MQVVHARVACTRRGPGRRQHAAELEGAGEVHRDERKQRCQRRHHVGVLQLEAPAELLAAGPQRQQHRRQGHERGHHAHGVGHAPGHPLARALARRREAQHLQRQHRKHARHEVQQHATHEREKQRKRQAQRRGARVRTGGRRVDRAHLRCWRRGRCHGGPRPGDLRVDPPAGAVSRHREHGRNGRWGVGALRVQRDAGDPIGAFPPVLLGGGIGNQAGRLGQELDGAPLQGGRQTADPHHEGLSLEAGARLSAIGWPGKLPSRGIEQGAVTRGRALHRQLQDELTRLRNADILADQPLGSQPDLGRAFRRGRGHLHGDGQQQIVFVAVVQQRPHRQLARRGPFDVARGEAGGQGPRQGGGQPAVAGILPVGVPVRRVLDAQAQPQRLARHDALWGVRHQLGPHLRRGHHGAGALCEHGQGKERRGGEAHQGERATRNESARGQRGKGCIHGGNDGP